MILHAYETSEGGLNCDEDSPYSISTLDQSSAVASLAQPAAINATYTGILLHTGSNPGFVGFLDRLIDSGFRDFVLGGALSQFLYTRLAGRGITSYFGKDLGRLLGGTTASLRDSGSEMQTMGAVTSWGPNVHVDGQSDPFPVNFGANEPSIDVSLVNPSFLIAGFHDERGAVFVGDEIQQFRFANAFCSVDGGSTWSRPLFSVPGLPGLQGSKAGTGFPFTFDVSVRFGSDGRAYVGYASLDWFDHDGDSAVDVGEVFTSILVVTTDCTTFAGPSAVVSEPTDQDLDGDGDTDFVFHDKPFVEADRLLPKKAYFTWTEFIDIAQATGSDTVINIRVRRTELVPTGLTHQFQRFLGSPEHRQ